MPDTLVVFYFPLFFEGKRAKLGGIGENPHTLSILGR